MVAATQMGEFDAFLSSYFILKLLNILRCGLLVIHTRTHTHIL